MLRDVSLLGSEDPPPLAGDGVGRIEPAEPAHELAVVSFRRRR